MGCSTSEPNLPESPTTTGNKTLRQRLMISMIMSLLPPRLYRALGKIKLIYSFVLLERIGGDK
ncbi:unnamed protein product [Sphenostylis stenocarpa]|uniref:Uncharacterized protein n=1 Tax=Sphenostylis stenocarpa TaxID=92480 RepID=A0AA86S6U1_9FABA|nr:unnamed protein product [Sphenostylis stenocarpa]